MLATMTPEEAKGMLKTMLSVQANAQSFKHMIIETNRFDEDEVGIIKDIFEAINQMIVVNMNCMRDIKKILESTNESKRLTQQ